MDRLRIIAEESGFFTREDAFEAGHDDRSIHRVIRNKGWRRVRPGAYTYPDLWPQGPGGVHRLVAAAAYRKFEGKVALSHVTAALEHDLPVWDIDLSLAHVTRLDGGSGRTQAGVQHHEGHLSPRDLVELNGRLVTGPVRAAYEAAMQGSSEAALCLFDALLHQDPARAAELTELGTLLDHWPETQHLRLPLTLADGRAESVGESRSRWLFFQQHLPAPELQFEVFDQGVLLGRTDFAWPEYKLLGEFDGRAKYLDLRREGETVGDVLLRERRRENLLCEFLGWRIVRITWADLADPRALAARIRRLLYRAA